MEITLSGVYVSDIQRRINQITGVDRLPPFNVADLEGLISNNSRARLLREIYQENEFDFIFRLAQMSGRTEEFFRIIEEDLVIVNRNHVPSSIQETKIESILQTDETQIKKTPLQVYISDFFGKTRGHLIHENPDLLLAIERQLVKLGFLEKVRDIVRNPISNLNKNELKRQFYTNQPLEVILAEANRLKTEGITRTGLSTRNVYLRRRLEREIEPESRKSYLELLFPRSRISNGVDYSTWSEEDIAKHLENPFYKVETRTDFRKRVNYKLVKRMVELGVFEKFAPPLKEVLPVEDIYKDMSEGEIVELLKRPEYKASNRTDFRKRVPFKLVNRMTALDIFDKYAPPIPDLPVNIFANYTEEQIVEFLSRPEYQATNRTEFRSKVPYKLVARMNTLNIFEKYAPPRAIMNVKSKEPSKPQRKTYKDYTKEDIVKYFEDPKHKFQTRTAFLTNVPVSIRRRMNELGIYDEFAPARMKLGRRRRLSLERVIEQIGSPSLSLEAESSSLHVEEPVLQSPPIAKSQIVESSVVSVPANVNGEQSRYSPEVISSLLQRPAHTLSEKECKILMQTKYRGLTENQLRTENLPILIRLRAVGGYDTYFGDKNHNDYKRSEPVKRVVLPREPSGPSVPVILRQRQQEKKLVNTNGNLATRDLDWCQYSGFMMPRKLIPLLITSSYEANALVSSFNIINGEGVIDIEETERERNNVKEHLPRVVLNLIQPLNVSVLGQDKKYFDYDKTSSFLTYGDYGIERVRELLKDVAPDIKSSEDVPVLYMANGIKSKKFPQTRTSTVAKSGNNVIHLVGLESFLI